MRKTAGLFSSAAVAGVFLFLLLWGGVMPLFSFSGAGAQASRSLRFPSVLVTAEIRPDGSMRVIEERTLQFDGEFQAATVEIALPERSTLKDVSVQEGDKLFSQEPTGGPGADATYIVEEQDGRVLIQWHFKAEDEVRTFLISYTVRCAVEVHKDVAELNWLFIAPESTIYTDYALVDLRLPPGTGKNEVQAWLRGATHGVVRVEEPNRVTWELERLPPYHYLVGRVVFPTSLVPRAPVRTGREALPLILSEEEQWIREMERQTALRQYDLFLSPLIALAALAYYLLVRHRSRRLPPELRGVSLQEMPAGYSPAETTFLIRLGRLPVEALTATVLDLFRRNHLQIEEYSAQGGGFLKKETTAYRLRKDMGRDSLRRHEEQLLQFLFEQAGKGKTASIGLPEVARYCSTREKQAAAFYRGWAGTIRTQIERRNIFSTFHYSELLVCGFVSIGGLVLFFFNLGVSGLVAVFSALGVTAALRFTRRLTAKGAEQYARWLAFKRFLKEKPALQDLSTAALEVWEHNLVYAAALGVAGEIIRSLERHSSALQAGSRLKPGKLAAFASRPGSISRLNTALDQAFRTAFRSPPAARSEQSEPGSGSEQKSSGASQHSPDPGR